MKKTKLMKIYLMCVCVILSCVACSSADKNETTTTHVEAAGDNSSSEETTGVSENQATSNDNESSNEETVATGESSSDEETSAEGESSSSDMETTSSDENGSTTEKETSSEKQTTTNKPSTEKVTRPVMQETTTSSGGSGGNTGNDSSDELTKLVDGVLAKIIKPSMNEAQKVLAIHDYLTYNVDYDYSNYLAGTIPWDSYSSYGALKYGIAVCDGYAKAFLQLATRAGLDAKRITGTADGGGHAWNQVKVDGVWYNLDATWDDPTWEGKSPSDHSANGYSYFLVSDTTLEKDHKPDAYSGKESCPKDFDGESFFNAYSAVNADMKGVCASNKTDLKTKILDYVNKGNLEFSIYVNWEIENYWEVFEEILAETKKPIRVTSSSGYGSRIIKYEVTKAENAIVVTSSSELAAAIKNNKNTIEDTEIWYFSDVFKGDCDSFGIINSELLGVGLTYGVCLSETPNYGKVVFKVKELQNTVILKNLDELKEYIKNTSIEDIKKYEIAYIGDMNSMELFDVIRGELISVKGYFPNSYSEGGMQGVSKIHIYDVSEVFYVEGVSQIIDYVNANGVDSLLNKSITTRCETTEVYAFVRALALELSAEIGYYVADSVSYYPHDGFVEFSFVYINKDVYVSKDVAGLKADIEDAIAKGTINNTRFYYIDKNQPVGDLYEAADALVKATGCNVSLWSAAYYVGEYYDLIITAN